MSGQGRRRLRNLLPSSTRRQNEEETNNETNVHPFDEAIISTSLGDLPPCETNAEAPPQQRALRRQPKRRYEEIESSDEDTPSKNRRTNSEGPKLRTTGVTPVRMGETIPGTEYRVVDCEGNEISFSIHGDIELRGQVDWNEEHEAFLTYKRNFMHFRNCLYVINGPVHAREGPLFLRNLETGQLRRIQSLEIRIEAREEDENGDDMLLELYTDSSRKTRVVNPAPMALLPGIHVGPHSRQYRVLSDIRAKFWDYLVGNGSATSCDWTRVSFRCATKHNGSRRTRQSFHVIAVALLARPFEMVDENDIHRVAVRASPRYIVIARSPAGHGELRRITARRANLTTDLEFMPGVLPSCNPSSGNPAMGSSTSGDLPEIDLSFLQSDADFVWRAPTAPANEMAIPQDQPQLHTFDPTLTSSAQLQAPYGQVFDQNSFLDNSNELGMPVFGEYWTQHAADDNPYAESSARRTILDDSAHLQPLINLTDLTRPMQPGQQEHHQQQANPPIYPQPDNTLSYTADYGARGANSFANQGELPLSLTQVGSALGFRPALQNPAYSSQADQDSQWPLHFGEHDFDNFTFTDEFYNNVQRSYGELQSSLEAPPTADEYNYPNTSSEAQRDQLFTAAQPAMNPGDPRSSTSPWPCPESSNNDEEGRWIPSTEQQEIPGPQGSGSLLSGEDCNDFGLFGLDFLDGMDQYGDHPFGS